MRILVAGFVVFVLWSILSVWLYVTQLKPAIHEPVAKETIPEPTAEIEEPPAQPVEVLPGEMMIYFGFDQFRFTTDQQTDARIAEFKAWIDKNEGSAIVITGHTDYIGADKYNQALGLRRARTVQQYLETKGIPGGRITISSEGEGRPAADNITSEGRAKNRRAEISIKK